MHLSDVSLQERGSIAIAEAIVGAAPPEEDDHEALERLPKALAVQAVSSIPLQVLSVDLKGNRSRNLP